MFDLVNFKFLILLVPGFRYYLVIVIRIPDGIEGPLPSGTTPEHFVSYEDAHESSVPAVYVAFQFEGSEYQKYRVVVVGGKDKSDSSSRDRREVEEYYNGPLQPDTKYRIFVRAFTSEVSFAFTSFG